MIVRSKQTAAQRTTGGLTSHVLLEKGDGADSRLAITWVDVAPGGEQKPHRHEPEQAYVIVRGQGRMVVDGTERDVGARDLVFVPPNGLHGIRNTGEQTLTYVSAATPTFQITALYDAMRP